MEYIDYNEKLHVPKNSGVKGLLKTVEAILKEIPSIKRIEINADGVISYTWIGPKDAGERKPLEVDFTELLPYTIIRNVRVVELRFSQKHPEFTVIELFHHATALRLFPICLVVGSDTILWKWLDFPTTPELLGYPILYDSDVPDDVLILCASYAKTSDIKDTYCSFKVTMLEVPDAK